MPWGSADFFNGLLCSPRRCDARARGGDRERTPRDAPAMNRFCTTFLLLLAFLSGAAALVYEVVFFRSLGLVFGVAVHAIAAVVESFLFGLGAGARIGGPALARRPPLKAYAALEGLIA